MEFDDGDPEPEVEGIPLADDDSPKPAKPKPSHHDRTGRRDPRTGKPPRPLPGDAEG